MRERVGRGSPRAVDSLGISTRATVADASGSLSVGDAGNQRSMRCCARVWIFGGITRGLGSWSSEVAVAMAGERMPQKSTFFFPKVLSGLVISPLDPGELVS